MFRSYYTEMAFTNPPPKMENQNKNYQLLYPNEHIIHHYSKIYPEQQRQFELQYIKLIDQFKRWGIAHKLVNENMLERLKEHINIFFDKSYSGNQSLYFFNDIKSNLEHILLVLTSDESISLSKKQKSFNDLVKSINVCAPGLYTHVEATLNRLISDISIERWLTEFRTNILNFFAETHISKHKIPDGNSIHVLNGFLYYAINEGWAPASKVNHMEDPFASTYTNITVADLKQLNEYFEQNYTPEAILNCISTNFIAELNQHCKAFAIVKHEGDWLEATPDFFHFVTCLANLIGMPQINFFDLSDDCLLVRFNPNLFRLQFLKFCQSQQKLFNPDLWQVYTFINGYKYFCFAENNFSWFENSHGEILDWEKLQDEIDPKILLGNMLTQIPEINWLPIIEKTVKNITSLVKTSADLGQLLAQLIEETSVARLLHILGVEYINSLIKTPFDIFEILHHLPRADRWKLNHILPLCHLTFDIDANEQNNVILLKQLLQGTHQESWKLACAAAEQGYASVIEALAEENALDVNQVNEEGLTLAHIAAKFNQAHIISVLAKFNADLNKTFGFGWTPTHIAAQAGHANVIKALARCNNVDLNKANKGGTTALHIAAKKGDPLLMQTLAECGANLNRSTRTGLTAAHMAVEINQINIIKVLVQNNFDFNQSSKWRKSPLTIAIDKKRWQIVALILKLGDIPIGDEQFLVHIAVAKGNLKAVQKLAEHKVNLNQKNKNGDSPVHIAAKLGNTEIMMLLANYKANLNQINDHGLAPIHIAVKEKAVAIIRILGERGANLNQLDLSKCTSAYWAAKKNMLEVIKVLCEFDVDFFNIKNPRGKTPFLIAFESKSWDVVVFLLSKFSPFLLNEASIVANLIIEKGDIQLIEKLIENNISFTNVDAEGNTLAHLAAYKGRFDLIKPLAHANVAISQANKQGCTPLHLAVEKNQVLVIKSLVECGADLNAINLNGFTPAHIAAQLNYPLCVKALAEGNANLSLSNFRAETPALLAKQSGNQAVLIELVAHALKTYDIPLIKSLLETKLNILLYTLKGNNLLHCAAQDNRFDIIYLLAEYGVDLNYKNRAGETAAQLAVENENVEVIKALVTFQSSFNTLILLDDTPLIIAFENQRWDMLVLMLMSIDINSIEQQFKYDLIQKSDELTNAFISLMHEMDDREKTNHPADVINGQNALGVILNSTNNPFYFFTQKWFQGKTTNIQRIIDEFQSSAANLQNDGNNPMVLS